MKNMSLSFNIDFFITFFQIEILPACTIITEAVRFILLRLMFTLPYSYCRRYYKHKPCFSHSI